MLHSKSVRMQKRTTKSNQLLWIMQMMTVTVLSLSSSGVFVVEAAGGPLGIPGTTQTLKGYDTEMGKDPICWSSLASPTSDGGIPFPNSELVGNFSIASKVELLPECPNGTTFEVLAPPEFLEPGFRPRTLEWYNYTVIGRVDLDQVSGYRIVSDEGSRIAVSVVACDTTRAGFCSPFVHEQANLREAKEKEKFGQTLFAPKRITGDRHGGTHVHAPAVIVNVTTNSTRRYFDFAVQVPMIINDPGTFFVIGTLQFFTGDALGHPTWRYDVANALSLDKHERLVSYQAPLTILEVTDSAKIVSYVAVGISSVVILFFLGQTIKNYKSQVLQISQAPFLVVFLVAALVAALSSLMYLPHSDMTCQLADPLVFISLQLMYGVTLGRLWRIHSVVSPLLRNRLQRGTTTRKNFFVRSFSCCESRRTSFRKEIHSSRVTLIAFFCTLPQVILQILGLTLQPATKTIEINDDESVGRCICDDGVERKHSIQMYSMLTLFLLILLLLLMAHLARQLPSLLNESSTIYDATASSVLLTVLGMFVLVATDNPTTSPDVSYMIYIVLVLSMTLNFSIRIMIPKLKMIWNGQTILVSKLVADRKQSLMDSSRITNRNSVLHNVTGLAVPTNSGPFTSFQNSQSRENGSCILSEATTERCNAGFPGGNGNCETKETITLESTVNTEHDYNSSLTGENMNYNMKASTTPQPTINNQDGPMDDSTGSLKSISAQEVWTKASKIDNDGDIESNNNEEGPDTLGETKAGSLKHKGVKVRQPKLIVKEHETPSSRLTIKLLDLHYELDSVTKQIMSGLEVARNDWESVRDRTGQLEELFSLVKFDWEGSSDELENEGSS